MSSLYHYDKDGRARLGPAPPAMQEPGPAAQLQAHVTRTADKPFIPASKRKTISGFPPPPRRRAINPAVRFCGRFTDVLREPMEQLSKVTRRSRGAGGEEERQHLRSLLNTMDGPTRTSALHARMVMRAMSTHRVSSVSQYNLHCEEKRITPFPATQDKLQSWLTWSVLEKDRPVASHAVGHHLSNLRVALKTMGQWVLTETENESLNPYIAMLQNTLPSRMKATPKLAHEFLLAACARLAEEQTLEARQKQAMISTFTATFARGTEVGGEDGQQWGDLTADSRGLAFGVVWSKKGKTTLDPQWRAYPHMPPGLEAMCPARNLLAYKEAWEAAGGTVGDRDLVWRRLDPEGRPTDRAYGAAEAMKTVRRELEKVGMPPGVMDVHWARHAGRDFLRFALGYSQESADLMGAWAPAREGGRSKRKSVGTRHYEHPTLDDFWREVERVAQKQARPVSGLCCRDKWSKRSGRR